MGKGNKDAGQINGLIDRGCSVEGKLTFDGTVQINGDFRGEILSDGTLIVGADARLNAKIFVDTIASRGPLVMVETHSGGQLADGRPYQNLYAWAVEVKDGKVHALREYFDSHYVVGLMSK